MKRSSDVPSYQPSTTHTHHVYHSFGHITCAEMSIDHSRALRSSMASFPCDWNRISGWPR